VNLASEFSSISYEQARELARAGDTKIRADLARRTDIKTEILYFLAEDKSSDVRRAIAENEATPDQANELLVRDPDKSVRISLAGKIARLAPNLAPQEQNQIHESAHGILKSLACDQISHVRQVLSETLKDIANAPIDVVKRLAMDPEIDVSGPVLEFSPILSDDDLLEIIRTGPATGGLNNISRRQSVAENISEAIIATGDKDAVATLIGNDSAQIREETLDMLVDQAEEIELWHTPLVSRPKLPPNVASKLATFVADDLLKKLQARSDLDRSTIAAITGVVHHRLKEEGPSKDSLRPKPISPNSAIFDFLKEEVPEKLASNLHESGKLDDKVITNALRSGDGPFVMAALAARSEIPLIILRKIFADQNAEGIIAVCWKAGMTIQFALVLQHKMTRITPTNMLGSSKSNEFPLSDDAMEWQLDFLTRI
jgi:uncharacterized protein (DUF2336 family)